MDGTPLYNLLDVVVYIQHTPSAPASGQPGIGTPVGLSEVGFYDEYGIPQALTCSATARNRQQPSLAMCLRHKFLPSKNLSNSFWLCGLYGERGLGWRNRRRLMSLFQIMPTNIKSVYLSTNCVHIVILAKYKEIDINTFRVCKHLGPHPT